MEPTFDIPDSTDWLDTPLTLLAPFESSLRCQVCKDFFDNPVITSCSHTFCSLCIRRCLSTEGKCPTCRTNDQELKLRRNWVVQELVEGFKNARPSILELARWPPAVVNGGVVEEPAAKKRKIDLDDGIGGAGAIEGVRTRSQSRGVTRQAQEAPIEIIDDVQDEEYIPVDGLVACPGCSRRMKEVDVFSHLDKCNGLQEPKPAAPAPSIAFGSLSSARRLASTEKPPERLPAINYSLLKDTALRKKLKDLGIPNWGARPLLQKRHTEWMNLWNANCDSKTPKPKRELLRELDIWERTQGGNSTTPTDSTSSVMRKDFDKPAWSANYDSDFKQLIANARNKSDAVVRSTIPSASQSTLNESDTAQPLEQSTESSPVAQIPDAHNAVIDPQEHVVTGRVDETAPILPQPSREESISMKLSDQEVPINGVPNPAL
ncbi:E3 ubiquitin-protein ligase RAD18 [Aspergillus stella-maris]|uniref:E3 ubiquitin-protein ligase RAD18 n=1 Tax=Aspergillus stella-maris TaxID=1810926 RepID=UPI003CCCB313